MDNQPKTFYKSKIIKKLTSETLEDLKEQLVDVKERREGLLADLKVNKKGLKKVKNKRKWLGWFPLSKIWGKKIVEWDSSIQELEQRVNKNLQDIEECKVKVDLLIDENVEFGFSALFDSFDTIQKSEKIWDITTSQRADRVALRTTAENLVERREVRFGKNELELIHCDYDALHLQNANGADLFIYPLFILMRDITDMALIDLKEVSLDFSQTRFIEEEMVPKDSEVLGYTWAKANKDGSRDKRFSNNYQIPVLKYGEIHFRTKEGLNEVYMVSNADAMIDFAILFGDYQKLL